MSKEAAFSVFCLENYKAYKSLTGKQTAELFRQYGVFDYLNEFYDVLNTTGYQYINHDNAFQKTISGSPPKVFGTGKPSRSR